MKFKFVLFIIAVFLAGACGSATESAAPEAPPAEPQLPSWPEFQSEAGGFQVKLPDTPTEQVEVLPTEAGDIELYMYMVEEGEAAFGVMFNELPEILTSFDDPEITKQMLDSGRDGALGNFNGVILSEEEITLDGHPGRDIVFEIPEEAVPGGGEGVFRLYLVDGNLYQIIAVGAKGSFTPEITDMFLNSFALLP